MQEPGAKVRVPLGSYREMGSPLSPPTEVTMLDIYLEEGAELSVPVAAGHCMFVMPIDGTVEVAAQRFNREDLKLPVFPTQDAPREVKLRASQGRANVGLFSGPPLPLV